MDFLNRLQTMISGGVPAFVEIFLLFLIILAGAKFLIGSRGAPVLRGILLLIGLSIGIVFFAANIFELVHIQWVFEKLAALFFLALLIIFQPELRRGLLRLGMHPIFRKVVRASSPAIDEVVDAVSDMSGNKVGALIAIQRTVSLEPYVEGGTRMNAEITKELLLSIFYPGTALHDGGVVIQGNRVAAAGCLFQLSENPELSKTLGTRHRAGLGLSEENDAVTVVVSEETGKISVCVDGKLTTGMTPDTLRKTLTELCIESVEGGA
ncbi:MAG: TIGR00159 family protein [Planctomycetes bacterium]|nr:TIGR00159 family protein [Planctomycetota bacterium]